MKNLNTNNRTIVRNGFELNLDFDGYLFSYSSSDENTNIKIPEEGIILLESMLKLGKVEFNKAINKLTVTSKSSKVYNLLYNMKELSYVNNPYDVIVYHCVNLDTGKIDVDNFVKLIEKLDPSIKLMEEDHILNKRLFYAIIGIIAKYNGMTVYPNQIRLPHVIVKKCLSRMKEDGFKIKIENGYEYVRDIIKEVLKNK